MVTQGPNGGLTPVEKSLVEHVRQGQWLDLIANVPKDEMIDEATMRSWGDTQTCSALMIRDILRGRLVADPDPRGLRLRGARITGRLDLENLTTAVNLELEDCLLEEGVYARDARLASVGLDGCQLEHPAEPPLDGTRLTCTTLWLARARVIGHADGGAVRLIGAHISGQLVCERAELRNDTGPALVADGLQVGQGIHLGRLTAIGSGGDSAVRLLGAHISGQLVCESAELRNDSGPALAADNLLVDQDMYLTGGFTATGRGSLGAVRLLGAHIGGNLECDGAKLRNDSGPALDAEGLQVDRGMRFGFTATGRGKLGAVRLAGAHVGGSLECEGASLCNESGPLLAIPGPALVADRLQVDQSMVLGYGFTATGRGSLGAVRLTSAHIGGDLDCSGAQLRNDSGPALNADGLQVDETIFLINWFTATGGGTDVAVDLAGAQAGRGFWFDPRRLNHRVKSRRLVTDGLIYPGIPQAISPQGWLELLRYGTPDYAAQPYQQLAAGFRALGDDRQARKTLIAQRDDQLARTCPGWWERLWGRITKVTLGYGYKPWRALWYLAVVVFLSSVLAVVLGAHGALAQTSKTATPGQSCTVVQQVSVGLDLNLPVGTSVARVDCDVTKNSASVTAAWLSAVGWVLRVLAWAFAALFIAGFTSAVRKT